MKKLLIVMLAGTIFVNILILSYIYRRENAVSKDKIDYQRGTDMFERFTEIMKRYKMDENNVPCSVEDRHKILKDLKALRAYIRETERGENTIPWIDGLLENITYHTRLKEYEKEQNKQFSTLKLIKEEALNSRQTMSISVINTKEDKINHSRKLRKKIFELMGYATRKTPLNPQVVERVDYGKYVMEKVIFDSEPGVSVPGYILIPKEISLPAPAVIVLHQHAGDYHLGANEVIGIAGNEPDQFIARELVERGYITFAIDARSFGERMEISEDLVDHLARWIGKNLLGMIIWDDIRAIDYLLTRKEVDPERIGCIGHSMGGTRAAYLAALDNRIKAVVVSGYVTSFKSLIKNDAFWPPSTWLPGILRYADCRDVLSLIASRPLLIVNGEYDDTVPIKGMLETYSSLQRIYTILKTEGKLKKIVFKDGHGFPESIHDEVYQWFDKWL